MQLPQDSDSNQAKSTNELEHSRGTDKSFLPSKLTTPYKGPYIVVSQYKNDVTFRHTNSGAVQVFNIDQVKPFYGSDEQATTLAQVDYQQFIITAITA